MKTLIALGKVAALFSSPLLLGLYVYDRSGGNLSSWFSPTAPQSEAAAAPPREGAVAPQSRQPDGLAVVPTVPMRSSARDGTPSQFVKLISTANASVPASDAIYLVKPASASTSGPLDVTVGQTPAAVFGAEGRISPFVRQYNSRSMLPSTKVAVLVDTPWKSEMKIEPATFGRLFYRDPIPPLPSATAGK